MTKTKSLPQQLIEYNRLRLERAEMVRELIYDLLRDSTQPLTVLEIRKLVQQYTGHLYDQSYVRNMLNEHVQSGRVSTRKELDTERAVRANSRAVRGTPCNYFWAPAGEVPARTETMVVDGLVLRGSDNMYGSSRRRSKLRARRSGPARVITMQTDSISELIDLIVSERVKPLQARIDELEKVLTGIKSALS